MGSSTYITKFIRKVCALLKVATTWKYKLPCSPGDHPDLDLIPLLCDEQHLLQQHLVGMSEWAVQTRSFYICFTLTPLNRFSAAPRKGNTSRLVKIFGYLQSVTGIWKSIVIQPEDIENISGKGANVKYWLEKYPNTSEDIDEVLPEPRGYPISTSV